MGHGCFTTTSYASYSTSLGKTYSEDTGRITGGQEFKARRIDESLDPRGFKIRECANSEEHPNTVPVILALDVTGSMGSACQETAEALGVIITELYKKYKDIEFCVMGIGDLAYDSAPIQMSQFESDVRIAEALDKIYMEHGGGGNRYESYTAAWYMGLHRTKLDAVEKQGRKGVIITMGDEPLNPYLPVRALNESVKGSEQSDVETKALYKKASEKFDIYHIAVKDPANAYDWYKDEIKESWGAVIGDHLKVSTINELSNTVVECISDSIQRNGVGAEVEENKELLINEKGEIGW